MIKTTLEKTESVLRLPIIQQIPEDEIVLFCAQWPSSMCSLSTRSKSKPQLCHLLVGVSLVLAVLLNLAVPQISPLENGDFPNNFIPL